MTIIYRGICVKDDEANQGKLKPKGSNIEVPIRYDGTFKCDGSATFGASESNTVAAHQKTSGMYGGCFLSFTDDKNVAKKFATSGYTEDGYVYEIDKNLLEKYGIVEGKPLIIENEHEREISLRAKDGGELPKEIIVGKYPVKS